MSNFDDERQRAREAILKRRAKLVAVAVAAGVAAPACGGKSSDSYCLSYAGGTSPIGASGTGGSRVCLSPPLGGTSFCLSIAVGGSTGGTNVCLGMPYAGESFGGVSGAGGAAEGGANEGGAAEGGAGAGGNPPIFCLSPPFGGTAPIESDGGKGGEAD